MHGTLINNKGKIPVTKIFGIGISFIDELIPELHFRKAQSINKAGQIENTVKFYGTSSLFINLHMDYHIATTTNKFYTGNEFLSKIGGYASVFNNIWVYIAPVFLLYFLYSLALVIKQGKRFDYKIDLMNQLQILCEKFLDYHKGLVNIDGKKFIIREPLWS